MRAQNLHVDSLHHLHDEFLRRVTAQVGGMCAGTGIVRGHHHKQTMRQPMEMRPILLLRRRLVSLLSRHSTRKRDRDGFRMESGSR